MRRSRSRSGLIETAFVSTAAPAAATAVKSGSDNNNLSLAAYSSSHEDLDDVDRLANHPVLRSIRQVRREGHNQLSLLRKSRSETGEVLLGGWGTLDHESISSNGSPKNTSVSGVSSAGRVLGRRAMAQRLGMSRSATAAGPQEFFRTQQACAPPGSPVSSSGTVSSWVFQHHGERSLHNQSQNVYHHHRHFHHHLNRNHNASSKSAPSTPPTWSEVKIANSKRLFSPVASTASPTESRKLEISQQQRQQEQLRGSPRLVVQAVIENAVTPVTHRDFATPDISKQESPKLADNPDTIPNSTPPNTAPLSAKFNRLQQPPQNLLKTQLNRQGNKVMLDSSEEGSVNDIQSVEEEDDLEDEVEVIPEITQQQSNKPNFVLSLKAKLSRRKEQVVDNSSSAESTPQKLASAQIRRGATQQTITQTKMGVKSKFLSSGESSCSSAMSSLESVRSSDQNNPVAAMSCGGTTSNSAQSNSNSEASSLATPPPRSSSSIKSRPSLELGWGKRAAGMAKFQVLSPISDKSQEQNSDHQSNNSNSNDSNNSNNKTPKVSPTTNSNASTTTTTPTAVNINNNNNNLNNNNNNNNNEVKEALAVPWDVPKLRRRLEKKGGKGENNLKQQHRRTTMAILADEDRLRGSDSGISIGSQDVAQDIKDLLNVPWDMPKLRKRQQQQQQGNNRPFSMPISSCPFPSQADNNQKQQKEEQEQHSPPIMDLPAPDSNQQKELVLPQNLPPPPDGFADSGDEYYLGQQQRHQNLSFRRRGPRPRMTLSFGADVQNRTLMFATNSPFALNDCEEVDPNLPLDRQDWYHGTTSKKEAESMLRSHAEGTYLVRKVDAARQEFALSLKSAKGYMHLKIRRDPCSRHFQLSDFDKRFMTVSQMVHHYSRNRLPIKGAEHMCCKTPLREQLL